MVLGGPAERYVGFTRDACTGGYDQYWCLTRLITGKRWTYLYGLCPLLRQADHPANSFGIGQPICFGGGLPGRDEPAATLEYSLPLVQQKSRCSQWSGRDCTLYEEEGREYGIECACRPAIFGMVRSLCQFGIA